MEQKLVILGLGNPGEEYENTYHNVGWLALDYIEKSLLEDGFSEKNGKWNNFDYSELIGAGKKYILVYPNTYMNLSGKAAAEAVKNFGINAEDLIVIHDDSDLPIGEIKGAVGSGAAGHNGVSSIIESLGTKDFYRIRIGIRDPKEATRKKAEDFVLNKIKKSDMEIFYLTFAELKSKVNEKSTP
jgi:PTH1 family peptidyl-tRNA hydrolase